MRMINLEIKFSSRRPRQNPSTIFYFPAKQMAFPKEKLALPGAQV
jgi:hypothetical protein